MKTEMINTIDGYIAQFSGEIKERLMRIRDTVRAAAPNAKEKISYQMPAFFLNGVLVYFAAFKNHIGFFPTSSGISAFAVELKEFKTSKGTIKFMNNEPVPYELISRITGYRVVENMKKI